ncbi:hypothetical protein ANN_02771 [Periplaneta americana]|uniref:Uncharacterized protein n=1 Tax=Periplaneta americana TaxID=6978 RepID=A0ABQ8U0P7_PERAM|nr:hypothetical protein ANN_02771 [Periplaneta americana]
MMSVFENKVLWKIFGTMRDVVTREWRKLHNAELQALYSTKMFRCLDLEPSGEPLCVKHCTRMRKSAKVEVNVGPLPCSPPILRPKRRWEDNIKMDLREVGYDDRDWINLAQDRDQWRAYVRAAMNMQVLKSPEDSSEVCVLVRNGLRVVSGVDIHLEGQLQLFRPCVGISPRVRRHPPKTFTELIKRSFEQRVLTFTVSITNHNLRSEELTGSRQIHVEAELPHLFRIPRIPSVSLSHFEGHQDCGNCAMLGGGDRMELSEVFV